MVYDNVDDSIIRRMRFACWIIKATVHTQNMLYLLLLHADNGYANAPQCYGIRTMVVLL